ncbi:MAG: nitroreductase/quinone reductase family protein [Mycobacterium sp.]
MADRVLYRLSGGRWTITAVSRIPSLTLLVTNGRGEDVVVPLQYLMIDGNLYIVGTNWSRPNHPVWSSWLMKRPHCRVNIGGQESSRAAMLMQGIDRDRVWVRILEEAPYQANCERKANRQPRVFRLDDSLTGAN